MPVRPIALSVPQVRIAAEGAARRVGVRAATPAPRRSVVIARATARTVLKEHGPTELVEDTQLLTSELVTNAFRYSKGDIFVRMRWGGAAVAEGALRVCVWDTSTAPPVVGEAGPEDAGGRGLFLVRRLAARWGTYDFALRGGGKAVWFELAASSPPCNG
jgi:anti-sigma regulatory factor (Ser/Thr protein kinase)